MLYLTGLRVAVPDDTLLALVRHCNRAASNLRHQASDAGNGGWSRATASCLNVTVRAFTVPVSLIAFRTARVAVFL